MNDRIINGYFLPFHFENEPLIHQTEKYIRLRPNLVILYNVGFTINGVQSSGTYEFSNIVSLYNQGAKFHSFSPSVYLFLYEDQSECANIDQMAYLAYGYKNYVAGLQKIYLDKIYKLIEDRIASDRIYDSIDDLFTYDKEVYLDNLKVSDLEDINNYFSKNIDYIFRILNICYKQVREIVQFFYTNIGFTIHRFLSYNYQEYPNYFIKDQVTNEDIGYIYNFPTGTTYWFDSGNNFKKWINS